MPATVSETAGLGAGVQLNLQPSRQHLAHFSAYDQEYQIPLTSSERDLYVTISSLANLVRHKYEVRILKASLDGDTHALPSKV